MLMTETESCVKALGYVVVEQLTTNQNDVVLIEGTEGRFVFKRFWKANSNAFETNRTLLPEVAGRYRELVIPECVDSGHDEQVGHWVILSHHEGERFRQPVGGAGVPLDTAGMMLDVAEGLQAIQFERLPNRLRRCLASRSPLDERRLHCNLEYASACELLTDSQVSAARETVQYCVEQSAGRSILTNGDFHIRNCIRSEGGAVALVDWDLARLSALEWCIAYHWFIMWDAPQWQRAFLDKAKERFSLVRREFRAILIAVALHQACGWNRKGRIALVQHAQRLIERLLTDEAYPLFTHRL